MFSFCILWKSLTLDLITVLHAVVTIAYYPSTYICLSISVVLRNNHWLIVSCLSFWKHHAILNYLATACGATFYVIRYFKSCFPWIRKTCSSFYDESLLQTLLFICYFYLLLILVCPNLHFSPFSDDVLTTYFKDLRLKAMKASTWT